MTLFGATRGETSGSTLRDLLETRCGALQVLSGRFTEDFGCEFGADFVVRFSSRSFGADFGADSPNGCANFGANFWCDFLQKRQTTESRIFKKNRTKFRLKIRTPFSTPGKGSGRGLGGGRDTGRSTCGSWLGAVEGNKATRLNCSLVPFHCLPCTVCLELCEHHLWNTRIWTKRKTKNKKMNPQDQNPFREIFRATLWHCRSSRRGHAQICGKIYRNICGVPTACLGGIPTPSRLPWADSMSHNNCQTQALKESAWASIMVPWGLKACFRLLQVGSK